MSTQRSASVSDDSSEPLPASAEDRFLRAVIVVAAAIGTLLWLASFIPVLRVTDPLSADGMQWIAAFLATPIYVVFVLPALILGIAGGRGGLNVGAVLLLLGVILAAFIFAG
jgi:cation transport ATPase